MAIGYPYKSRNPLTREAFGCRWNSRGAPGDLTSGIDAPWVPPAHLEPEITAGTTCFLRPVHLQLEMLEPRE